jgi:hypothetical protein
MNAFRTDLDDRSASGQGGIANSQASKDTDLQSVACIRMKHIVFHCNEMTASALPPSIEIVSLRYSLAIVIMQLTVRSVLEDVERVPTERGLTVVTGETLAVPFAL